MPKNSFFEINANEICTDNTIVSPNKDNRDLASNSGSFGFNIGQVKVPFVGRTNGKINSTDQAILRYKPFTGIWGEIVFSCDKERKFVGQDSTSKCPVFDGLNETRDGSIWIAGHLLNGKLGGLNCKENFAPISSNLNKLHSSQCENIIQNMYEYPKAFFQNPTEIIVVYRTHVISPINGEKYPEGLCVSIGFYRNKKLLSLKVVLNMLDAIRDCRNEEEYSERTRRGHNIFKYSLKHQKKTFENIKLMIKGNILTYPTVDLLN